MKYLVIGAGSAGNVLARRLLDAGHDVTLVEAGNYDVNPNIDHLNTLGLLWHSEDDWDYYTVPQPGANGRRLHVPRGKVMGGSHALNACIWVRGAREDYDNWSYNGCPGWSWDEVLPYFKKIEKFDGELNETRSDEGLLDVCSTYPRHDLQESMVQAAVEAGFPLNKDYNSGNPEGISRMQLNIRDLHRFSTFRAYILPVKNHKNLTILTGHRVTRLLFEGTQVTGAQFLKQDGTVQDIFADVTILCAGALGSPEILLRSGIGPADELAELGIKVIADVPGVGKNLHDHMLAPVIFTTTQEISMSEAAPAQTHLFAKSTADQLVPDTQPIFFSNPMYSQGYPGDMTGPDQAFTLMAGIVRPQSRGELTLTGADISDPVSLDLAALKEQTDADALVASLKHCRTIGRQAALAEEWGAEEIWPGPQVTTDEELEEYARNSVVTYHHQVGTCAMGQSAQSVTNPRTLEVYKVSGLYVADASVMPTVPTGNTNAPSIMIAERAADFILSPKES
ncbi:GMC family oxidoreductase [Rothia amarae]|uniref:GMC family oxidoreductase n=1 Tax=Rothia amarae TaxID=169480 RepID=UPI001247E40F